MLKERRGRQKERPRKREREQWQHSFNATVFTAFLLYSHSVSKFYSTPMTRSLKERDRERCPKKREKLLRKWTEVFTPPPSLLYFTCFVRQNERDWFRTRYSLILYLVLRLSTSIETSPARETIVTKCPSCTIP